LLVGWGTAANAGFSALRNGPRCQSRPFSRLRYGPLSPVSPACYDGSGLAAVVGVGMLQCRTRDGVRKGRSPCPR
jgi:hypothetical protein